VPGALTQWVAGCRGRGVAVAEGAGEGRRADWSGNGAPANNFLFFQINPSTTNPAGSLAPLKIP